MQVIGLIDPSIGTENVGDEIIYDAVRRELDMIFNFPLCIRVSSHEFMLWESRRVLSKAQHIFVGGSNLLKSKMEWNTQWKLSPFDLIFPHRTTLLGCGWRHYESNPTPYTKRLYRRVLSPASVHSVRDGMTLRQLQKTGLSNVVNTSCVTMWNLDEAHCAEIPTRKADAIVVTVTAYDADKNADGALIAAAFRNYRRVILFIQQPEDLAYAESLTPNRFSETISSLAQYDRVLQEDVDYVGTRLHGGIRALQKKKRTLVVAIDNRAREITEDTNLPTIQRDDVVLHLEHWMNNPQPTRLALPVDAIAAWRDQFAKISNENTD